MKLPDRLISLALIALGILGISEAFGLPIGSAERMGPGYFVLLASTGLICFGLAVFLFAEPIEVRNALAAVRPCLSVCLAIGLWAASIDTFGLVTATFGMTLLLGLGDRDLSMVEAMLLGLFLSLFGAGVFVYSLGMQLSIFGSFG